MPTYEYKCINCGVFEVTQRITQNPLTICPTCAGEVVRLISLTSFVLKGSGWYATDYARNGKSGGDGEATAKDSATGNGSGDKSASSSPESPKSSSSQSSMSGTDSAAQKGASSKPTE